MTAYELQVFADYHQFYVWDAGVGPLAPEDYTDEDVRRRVKVAPNVVVVQPDIIENDDFADFEADLRFQIVDAIQSIPTRDAYQWCEKELLRRRAQREVENQNRQNYLAECRRRASAFQRRYLPWLPTRFIDKPLWRNSGIEQQLREALNKADSKTLEALKAVGLTGHFSNSVAFEIEKVLAEASRNSLN